ncbi:MAG: Chemotaxis protein methyltransferase CheR [Armatimonadetes bacterium]|nr:Chemotaxis protein methyltransferase CheR [Armatimonadota bacterium]
MSEVEPEARRPVRLGDEQFRLLLEAVQDYAICLLDSAGSVASWNPGAARLKGYAAEEIIGEHVSRFYTPEDIHRGHPEEELRAALETGRHAEEGWRVRKDGSRFWAHVVITPVYDAGEHVGYAKVTRDLTERRQAQDAARRLTLAEAARADAERAAETLRRLQSISEAALSHAELDDLLRELLQRLRELFQADTAVILLRDGDWLSLRAGSGVDLAVMGAAPIAVGAGFAGRVAAEGRPVILSTVVQSDLARPGLWEQGIRSLLGVPLLVAGRVTGVLHVGMRRHRDFSEEDATFLQLAADRAALAIQNAQFFREAREAAERLFLLAHASTSLLPVVDSSRTLPTLLSLAQQLLHADAYAVWREDRRDGSWSVVAQSGLSAGYPMTARSGAPLPDRPFVISDIGTAEMPEDRRAAMRAEGIRTFLCCPLRMGRERSGSIVFYRRDHEPFGEPDLQVASALGSLAGAAVTTTELGDEQRRLQVETEQSRQRLAFLAEASRILASSLDYEETLKGVADLLVPHLADWCTVHLLGPDGTARVVAVSHSDPSKLEWALQLPKRPYEPEMPRGVPQVLRTGKPELRPVVTDAMLVQDARDPAELEILRQVGFSSTMIVPLRARDRTFGALSLIAAESGAHYDEAALAFAEDLARRAADAIDNALLYQEAQSALESARRNAARARRLMESNIIGIQVGRLGGAIAEANDAFLELAGRLRSELRAGDLAWDRLIAPDCRRTELLAREQLRAGGVCAPYETELIRPDGLRVPVLVGAARFEDEPDEAVTFVLDLSERRRLEEGVRFAMEHAHCLLWHAYVDAPQPPASDSFTWDLHFFDEQAAQRFLPLTRLPGETYAEALIRSKPEDDREQGDRIARAAFAENRRGYDQEYRCRRADGEIRWLHERTHLARISATRWRAVGVCTDSTERKRLEQELRDRVRELAEEDQRKDEFLAMLAHELRNPLGAVSNAVHLLQQPVQSPEQRTRALEVLKRQVTHQTRLVEDLLDVSRIERGLVELRAAPLDLVALVRDAVEDWRQPLERERLVLTATLPEEPVYVQGDATRLTQVLGNLLSNAGKFTEAGGTISVDLHIEAQGQPIPLARLRVRDTGTGIDSELLPRIFESFTQSDRSLARSRGGLGLGLAIVKGLIELHGGTVTAASEGASHGAEIEVRLPLLQQAAAPPPAAPPPSAVPVGLRILVVEDNRDAAETLAEILELDGHKVEVAFSGPAGVEAARRLRPDVVLCDIGLPGMDGYQVAASLRADPALAGMRLIAVTGYGQDEDRRRTREAGFDAHLTKPVEIPALQRVLEQR